MPTISYVSQEQLHALEAQVIELREMLQVYVSSNEEWLPTNKALEAAQISRATLVMSARADAPDTEQAGRITYRKQGTKCLYARTSCVDYSRRKIGRPTIYRA